MSDRSSGGAVVLVTGVAGFIGFHLTRRLLDHGFRVVGIDNLNDYYDVALKQERLSQLVGYKDFDFQRVDIADADATASVFQEHEPEIVVNLAAQAGVRYSLENPRAYAHSNLTGFLNILEGCRSRKVSHFLYASSSSVYGGNEKVPFEESDPVDHPISLYAATKRSNELMADCYAHLYGIPSTGLRFFTVYGPYGRPDMAYFSFTDRYFQGRPINIYSNPRTEIARDFTYIDDVVESLVRLISKSPTGVLPHRVLNIGGSNPAPLSEFIEKLESALSAALEKRVEFDKIFEPQKPGDVPATFASTAALEKLCGYHPHTQLDVGLQRFAEWYVAHYGK